MAQSCHHTYTLTCESLNRFYPSLFVLEQHVVYNLNFWLNGTIWLLLLKESCVKMWFERLKPDPKTPLQICNGKFSLLVRSLTLLLRKRLID